MIDNNGTHQGVDITDRLKILTPVQVGGRRVLVLSVSCAISHAALLAHSVFFFFCPSVTLYVLSPVLLPSVAQAVPSYSLIGGGTRYRLVWCRS